MTDAEALGSCQRLRRILKLLVRISSAIGFAKAKSSQNGDVFTGWTARIEGIGRTGPMERSVVVFDIFLRFSECGDYAEYVLTDADGNPIIVLPCTLLSTVDILGRKKRRRYKIVTDGTTLILAA